MCKIQRALLTKSPEYIIQNLKGQADPKSAFQLRKKTNTLIFNLRGRLTALAIVVLFPIWQEYAETKGCYGCKNVQLPRARGPSIAKEGLIMCICKKVKA